MGRVLPRFYSRLSRRFGAAPDLPTRRRFLEASLAAGAAGLLSASCAGTRARSRSGPRVAVVGAGFAGLACAHELDAAGCDVAVLEARARTGGRVLGFADLVPGKVVEGGGELVGWNHPRWLAYSERFGLELRELSDEEEDLDGPVVLEGRRLDPAEARELFLELERAFASSNALAAEVDADAPWTSPRARELDVHTVARWVDGLDATPLARRALRVLLGADNGVPVERQSLLGLLAMVRGGGLERYWTESEVARCAGGNARLAEELARSLGPSRLALGRPVAAVEDGARAAQVLCAGGERLEADLVVIAVPPSAWDAIRFDPPLPAEMRLQQMGTTVKHLATVRERYWRARGLAADALAEGDVELVWEATDGQPGPGAALVAFSSGPAAEACRARTGAQREAAYERALEALLPGYSAARGASRTIDWPGDRWTRAGYSFPAPGEVCAVGPLLRRPHGRVHFAGEHASTAFPGYMEGALASGAEVARRIAVEAAVARAR